MLDTYHLNTDGCQAVKKMMHVVAKLHPEVSYAPMLCSMTSLLLHYYGEEKVRGAMSG